MNSHEKGNSLARRHRTSMGIRTEDLSEGSVNEARPLGGPCR